MAQPGGAASPEDTLARSLCRAMIDSGARTASPPLRMAQSAPAQWGGVDRLAQLKQLIEQDKTLAAIVRGGRSEQQVELSQGREQPPSSRLALEDKAFAHHWQDEAGSAPVDPGSCDEPTGATLDPPDHGAYDNPDYSNGLPDQRRGLKVFAALVGLALAGSVSAFAYLASSDRRGRGDDVPAVATSISPDKTVPSPREQSRADERLADQAQERTVNTTGLVTTRAEEPADAKPPMPEALDRKSTRLNSSH